nr:hypothetical protein CFP56_54922 [Quercus suber]
MQWCSNDAGMAKRLGPAPQHANPGGRPTSPMPPPPIDPRSGAHAYAPPHQQQVYAQCAPPSYNLMSQEPQGYGYSAPGAPQAIGGASYQQRLARFEGSQRSGARSIVGIDIVHRHHRHHHQMYRAHHEQYKYQEAPPDDLVDYIEARLCRAFEIMRHVQNKSRTWTPNNSALGLF